MQKHRMSLMNNKMNNSHINIDIVLPCYNPPLGWEKGVITNFRDLQNRHNNHIFHLYIVTDGSVKGYEESTINFLKTELPEINIVHYIENRGKGYALRYAVSRCTSKYIMYTDYDFPYTDQSVDGVIQELHEGFDVVVAERDRCYQRNLTMFRKFLSYSSHTLNQYILRLNIKDTQGGLKGFNRKGRSIFLETTVTSFLFDTEFIYKATHKRNIKISTVKGSTKIGIACSNMGFNVLRNELFNFFKILWHK
jgi:glycosyltransferase involved in cell wall biosynthesis